MKILFISEFFPSRKDFRFSGGVETRTFFVAKNLAKRHRVTVLTSKLPNTPNQEKMFNFKVFRVGPHRNYQASAGSIFERIKFIKSAISFAQTLEVDLIDGTNFITHFITAVVAWKKKTPSVAWYPDVWIGSWIQNAGLYGLLGELLERINLIMSFKAYIAISKETANKLKKFTKAKINIISCGVDQNEFKNHSEKYQKPTIICVSRLTKYKNIRTLIFSFAYLSIKVKNAQLFIIGSGPDYKNLRDLVKNLKLSQKVKFLSNLPRENLIEIIKSSHIFSLPSIVEGFGIATIEAAAAGVPYVNASTSIQKEVTLNGKGGFLVEAKSPLIFSKRFFELFDNKPLYRRKSKEAIDLAKHYNWERVSKETEKVYKKIL